jgi:hypothetical protein
VRVAEEVRAPIEPLSIEDPDRGGFMSVMFSGIALLIVFFLVSSFLGNSGGYDTIGAFVVAPLVFAFTIPILSRQAKREGDKTLMTLLVIALILKLLGAIARYVFAIDVYGGKNDAIYYDYIGRQVAASLRSGQFTNLASAGYTGTDFIQLLTGIVYTIIGDTIIGGFLFFSWLGFLGLFLFYRAFTIAVPEGRRRTYLKFIFFMPSLLFWPSSIGKESWMMFSLGIAAYGAANLLNGKMLKGTPILAIGLWFAALPRPHIAALAGIAIAAAFLLKPTSQRLRAFAPILKLVTLAIVAVAAVFFVGQAQSFLQSSGVNTTGGLSTALTDAASKSSGGKSSFTAPVITSPKQVPLATVTVLFRPTLIESHSPQGALAASEGTFLAIYTMVRFGWGMAALRLIRRRPYIAFSFVMVGLLIFAFSTIGNLGILARERVQLLPFYFVVFCVPSKRWRARREAREKDKAESEARLRGLKSATLGA